MGVKESTGLSGTSSSFPAKWALSKKNESLFFFFEKKNPPSSATPVRNKGRGATVSRAPTKDTLPQKKVFWGYVVHLRPNFKRPSSSFLCASLRVRIWQHDYSQNKKVLRYFTTHPPSILAPAKDLPNFQRNKRWTWGQVVFFCLCVWSTLKCLGIDIFLENSWLNLESVRAAQITPFVPTPYPSFPE